MNLRESLGETQRKKDFSQSRKEIDFGLEGERERGTTWVGRMDVSMVTGVH